LGCARFNFEDLCGKPLGAEDFLSIAKEFDFIFIENIPKMSPEKRK
jgi:cell division protein ZapE